MAHKRKAVPSDSSMFIRVRREHLRWLCLELLDSSRPEAMAEQALLAFLRAVYPDSDELELRRELDYLALHNLLTITDKAGNWWIKLTHQGVDIVEYTSHCPPGIARPPG